MIIRTVSPLPLSQDSWSRDITVIYRGFVSLGHDTGSIRLPSLDGANFPGILQVSPRDLSSPNFWRKLSCDLVILNSWAMPCYNNLISAIIESGAKVLVRLDSNGYNSPWCGFWRYFLFSRLYFIEKGASFFKGTLKAAIKTLIYSLPQCYDYKMLNHLELADVIGIESGGAKTIFERLLQSYRRHDLIKKLRIIRHPVIPEIEEMIVAPIDKRSNCIVAVGRWSSPLKDAPLLIKTLSESLASNPTWLADIYGTGASVLKRLVSKYAANVEERINIYGPKPHEEILQAFQRSKICLFTSRFESGPIAGEEALCLGCSLVGPPDVPSMHDLCAPQFGTLPTSRRPADISRAIDTEISQWDSGLRDPKAISCEASAIYSAKAVCKNILAVFSQ